MDLTIIPASDIRQRTTPTEYDEKLRHIAKTPEYHGEYVLLGQFDQKNKASSERSKLTERYGAKPAVAGFSFIVDKDRLMAHYDPAAVVPGAADEHKARIAQKKAEAKEKAAAKKAGVTPQTAEWESGYPQTPDSLPADANA